MEVTKDTLIGELLEAYPGAENIILKHIGNIGCISCPGKHFDTLEAGAALHGLSTEQIDSLVQDIKKAYEKHTT